MTQERYLEEAGREQKGPLPGAEAPAEEDGPVDPDEQHEPDEAQHVPARRGSASYGGAQVQAEVQR